MRADWQTTKPPLSELSSEELMAKEESISLKRCFIELKFALIVSKEVSSKLQKANRAST